MGKAGGSRIIAPAHRTVAPVSGKHAAARTPAPHVPPVLAPRVQTKLRVGTRGDRYEREADRAADAVMQSLDGAESLAPAAVGIGTSADVPPVQPMCAECARTGEACDECEDEQDDAGPPPVQRMARDEAPDKAPMHPLIVDETAEAPARGAMRKPAFLSLLRSAVCVAADAELARGGRSTQGCPYLDYWFGLLERRDAAFLERALLKYAPETRSARSANDYIAPVVRRVRRGVSVWVATGKVTGVPPDLASLTGEGGAETSARAVQRKPHDGQSPGAVSAMSSSTPRALQASLGAGRALDAGIRGRMESAFGADFSRVRVHVDPTAANLSTGLGARAFTVGEHVAFDAGEYQPGTLVGDALIAHELAHVVQQGAASRADASRDPGVSESYDALEHDADYSALGAVASLWRGSVGALARLARTAMPALRGGVRLQRCKDDRPKICPKGKVWAPMPAPLGAGPVCICRWHCVDPPAPRYVDSAGNDVATISCSPGPCRGPNYADEDDVVEGPDGKKIHVESPTSTGVGAHFTPISGENACGCIPPGDISGIGADSAPLMAPGLEVTDAFPHAGAELGGGAKRYEGPPVERDRIVIEGPAVAGERNVAPAEPITPAVPPENVGTPVPAEPIVGAAPPAKDVATTGAGAGTTATVSNASPGVQSPATATTTTGQTTATGKGGTDAPSLATDPAARTVWGTRKSQIYHEEGSAHYEQMKKEGFPNDKGRQMTAAEAQAAGYRAAKTSGNLDAARRGLAEHAMIKDAMRPSEGKLHEGGWRLVAVERMVGEGQRVDELWVNDTTKRVFVADTYTGLVEPPEHYRKGWGYANAEKIKAYLDKGYTYDYSVGIKHPDALQ